MDIFGDWKHTDTFPNAIPYPHVVIDNFFTESVFDSISQEFGHPDAEAGWMRYWNPIEKKYAFNSFESKPGIRSVFETLESPTFIERLQQVTRIPCLLNDSHLHGAGLHYHPRGGKLDMHLDYSIHPVSGLERKLNLIVYMNEEWQDEWGGALEMWDSSFTHCVKSVYPHRNRAVLFQTSDISYHGIPTPIQCPESVGRRSLAIYYMTHPTPTTIVRHKAEYRPLPGQIVSQQLQTLYDIRKVRRISESDLWDGWNKEDD